MRFLASLLLACALAGAAAAQTWEVPVRPARSNQSAADREFFPVAVWYSGGKYRAPMISRHPAQERAEWRRDLVTIKSTGFNTVKTWVDWATTEPVEGQYHLDDLRQLLDLAHQVGLRVIVQIYADSAPDWVGRKYPDAEFVTATGVKIHSQAAPGYCFDSQGVRNAVLGFYRAVAKVGAASPATYGYDLWSEPHIVNWVWFNDLPHAQFCYCPYTRARFRDWLRQKYGTLGALDASWYRTFENWQAVDPPRFGTILSYADFLDWKAFISDKLAEDLRAKEEAVHAVDPTHLTTSHSDIPTVLASPLDDYGMPDDWKMAPQVDYYGSSIYPKHASAKLGGWAPAFRAFSYDGEYSASGHRGFYVGELQAGQGATGLRVNVPVEPSDIRDWTWSLIAHGAKAICYYAWYPMNAGYESNGYGFIDLDGSLTARARMGGQIARVVSQHSDLFHDAQPLPARIAILYNPLSYLSGGDTVGPGTAVRDSMQGVYQALWQENIPVEFIHAHQVELGGLARYQAVYLPYPITLSRAASSALASYVENGGTVISEARLAWNDEHGDANVRIPGAGLDQVFGVRETALWPGTHADYTFAADAPEGLAGLKVPASQFEEDLSVVRGTIWARFGNGQPAVVVSRYGKGRTVFIGSFLGMAAEKSGGSAIRALQALAAWAGARAPVEVAAAMGGAASQVEARLLRDGSKTLLIAINRGAAGSFDFTLAGSAGAHATDLLANRALSPEPVAGGTRLHLALEHEGVAVILLTPGQP
ncbi:MAG: beta-galactosidase [Terriglobales bacterium]